MIVTVSGPSGIGKTSILRAVLKNISAGLITSYVAGRERRDSDIPGEYRYVWRWWFKVLDWLGLFIWTIDLHGNSYGTIRRHVNKGLSNKEEISFMIISPDKVVKLWEYALKRGSEEFVKSYYITSSAGVIVRRLKGRGDSEFDIAKRLRDCNRWDIEAENSAIPYNYISNDGTVEDSASVICDDINRIKSGENVYD